MKFTGGKFWFTAAELAELKLPGLPSSKRKVNERAAAECWALKADADGMPLTPPDMMVKVTKDAPLAGTWWGKFPAPPAEIKTVSLTLPEVEAIENIPLSDR